MNDGFHGIAGLRVLVVEADDAVADALGELLGELGALAATASALDEALDRLEAADPPFHAAIIGRRLDDGGPALLARAIRTSPLLFDLRVVVLDESAIPEGGDVACPWPAAPAAVAAALVGPITAHAPAESEAPVLDLDELEAIAGGLTPEIVRMLQRFAAQAQALAHDAMAAAAAADPAAAQSRAHALKGAALSAGAIRLGRAAHALETAAAALDWETAAAIDLAAEVGALAAAIGRLSDPPA